MRMLCFPRSLGREEPVGGGQEGAVAVKLRNYPPAGGLGTPRPSLCRGTARTAGPAGVPRPPRSLSCHLGTAELPVPFPATSDSSGGLHLKDFVKD